MTVILMHQYEVLLYYITDAIYNGNFFGHKYNRKAVPYLRPDAFLTADLTSRIPGLS